ncbi:MAG: hypothetical protein D3915_15840 [Candidatus Electrothrix sp. AU1_5]|nr:hypothetical protein [Candidatus Electrothrix gigas]
MKRGKRCISIFLYSVVFFSIASSIQAKTDFNMYIWEFGNRNGMRDETTQNITREFETALIGTQCCTVLERRNYNRLMKQKGNEKAVMSIDGITDASVSTLKNLEAGAVIFGEVYDDVASGEVKVSAVVQDFTGKSLTKQSIRFSRGKLSDAASREENMNALANKLCSALVEEKVVKYAKKAENIVAVNYSSAVYKAGDIAPQLGEHNMIINTKNGLGLTSSTKFPTMITLEGFSYRDKMELKLDLDLAKFNHVLSLSDRNREVIALKFKDSTIFFGDYKEKYDWAGWKSAINNLKITIQGNLARLYLNDKFLRLEEVTFDTIDKVTMSGIKRDKDFIYSISVTPMD